MMKRLEFGMHFLPNKMKLKETKEPVTVSTCASDKKQTWLSASTCV